MNSLRDFFADLANIAWGPLTVVLILGVGILLTIRLNFLSIRSLGYGFRLLWKSRGDDTEKGISGFSALMTALSATVGVGNIAGVSLAITLGGPGALFWMWMSALVGMATKYSESVLAVRFREVDSEGSRIGGPMYYIKNGLGKKWYRLAAFYAFFGAAAAFGIGNMTQGNTIAAALDDYGLPPVVVAVALVLMVGGVILGGIRRIAGVAAFLVPFFILSYLFIGFLVIVTHIDYLPTVFGQIISSAFTGTAATGGFAGVAVWAAIRHGIARGVFSNEAGLGSASIAHAASSADDPVRQGTIAMLGTFIDTIVVCSITGFLILLTGVWHELPDLTGADLTKAAMSEVLPGANHIVAAGVIVFGFTTMLGWSYYGEKCCQYLFGDKSIRFYRVVFSAVVSIGPLALYLDGGARAGIEIVWFFSETLCALMAIPNLIALILLAPVIAQLTFAYYGKGKVSATSPLIS